MIFEVLCHGGRVVGVNGFLAVITLEETDTTASKQIDGWVNQHVSGIDELFKDPGTDCSGLFRVELGSDKVVDLHGS